MPPEVFRRKLRRLWVLSCVGVIKISFSFSFSKEIHAPRRLLLRVKHLKGVSFRGPLTPTKGLCPLDPRDIFAPSNNLTRCRPCISGKGLAIQSCKLCYTPKFIPTFYPPGPHFLHKYLNLHTQFFIYTPKPSNPAKTVQVLNFFFGGG